MIPKFKFKLVFFCAIIHCTLLPTPAARAGLPELWSKLLGSSVDSCPAMDTNGNLYVTGSGTTNYKDFSGGKLVVLTPEGKSKWEFKTTSDIKSSPAIGSDGTIYFGCRDRKFYAVSPQGKQKWQFTTAGWIDSSPAIATSGVIYFSSWDKKFYALNPDGTKKWEFATEGPIDSSAAIAADGTIYFGSHDKTFYALNPDGTKKWSFTTGGAIISSPALHCDGTIYFTSVDGNFYAMNRDGSKKWTLKTGGARPSSPVIDVSGNIYVGANDTVESISPAGMKRWDFGHPIMDGTPAVAEDGTVYFPANGPFGVGTLFSFNKDGGLMPHTVLYGNNKGSPAIAKDGKIFIGSGAKIFALQGTNGLAKSCWPKFRGDAAQTGRVNAN